jgi:V8-like Glu-specific endopeptidase
MNRLAGAIVLTALAFLGCGSRAQETTSGYARIPAPLLPGISSHDPRIRVDADAAPWRAVGKVQVSSVNFRAGCTATLIGQSMVVAAAHCLFNCTRPAGRC